VPHFVIDAPGGGGKVPLLPEYVEEITEDSVTFRNYQGERYVYKQPKQAAVAAVSRSSAGHRVHRGRGSAQRKTKERRRRTGRFHDAGRSATG
jgi:hypothetical protein